MHTAIVWFRRDLRLGDHPALKSALEGAGAVVPVYIHDPVAEGEWAPGGASRWWLHRSLAELETALRQRGSQLIIRSGDALTELSTLARETRAGAVHWNRLYEPSRISADVRIESALKEQGLDVESYAGALLHEPRELKTGSGAPYRVFTPFWRNFQKTVLPAEPISAPRRLKPPRQWPGTVPLAALGLLPNFDWADDFSRWWSPGERGAGIQLRSFLRRALAGYAEGRNYPARTQVSYLSPHLHFGEVSPRQVWHAVRSTASGANAGGADAYLREIGWREFAHHVLFHFPHTPTQPMYPRFAPFPWRRDYGALLEAWRRGRTGYPIVDAGMRELWATGWMHNRVRMLTASFLVKNLRIPWQEGARWFWDTLVDADLANNSMGWQWSAGCGADAAPYFRIFNPVGQAEKFDPTGEYLRRWLPELSHLSDASIHAPWKVGGAKGYPMPVVDYSVSRAEALAAYARLKP